MTRTFASVYVSQDAKNGRNKMEMTALVLTSHVLRHAPQEKVAPPLLPTSSRPPSQVASAPLLMEKIHVMLFMEVNGPPRLMEAPAQPEVMTPVKVTPVKVTQVKEKVLVQPNSSPVPWFSPPLF